MCVGACGVFLVLAWCVLPIGEYEEDGRWDVGFELLGVGYGMFHGNAHANICVVIFGVRDIDPLPCNSSVATARAEDQISRVERVVGVGG